MSQCRGSSVNYSAPWRIPEKSVFLFAPHTGEDKHLLWSSTPVALLCLTPPWRPAC